MACSRVTHLPGLPRTRNQPSRTSVRPPLRYVRERMRRLNPIDEPLKLILKKCERSLPLMDFPKPSRRLPIRRQPVRPLPIPVHHSLCHPNKRVVKLSRSRSTAQYCMKAPVRLVIRGGKFLQSRRLYPLYDRIQSRQVQNQTRPRINPTTRITSPPQNLRSLATRQKLLRQQPRRRPSGSIWIAVP
jgi:hypothetical protein